MRNRKTKLYPRWWARLLALVTGYYWIPCPICQDKFAGFEDGGYLIFNAQSVKHAWSGKHVCPDCTVEAERLNKINMPRFMEEYGELYGELAYEPEERLASAYRLMATEWKRYLMYESEKERVK